MTQLYYYLQDAESPEIKMSTESVDESNYIENEIADDTDGNKSEKDDLYYDKEECSMQEYEIMKVTKNLKLLKLLTRVSFSIQDNLLLYNHARLMSQDNHSKDYLVSIMFSHYDKNNNGNLETTELNEVKGELIQFRTGPDVKSFFSFRPLSQWDSFCVITWCCGTVSEWSIFVTWGNAARFLI